jgi:hypothetical protein
MANVSQSQSTTVRIPTAVENWFGNSFGTLHPQLQTLHREGGTLTGPVRLSFGRGAAGWIGRRVARHLGIPTTAGEHCLRVCIHSADGTLHWDRCFDAHSMFRSTFTPIGTFPTGYWIEQSGAMRLLLAVRVIRGGWHWEPFGSRLGTFALPRLLLPRTIAYKEIVDGFYHFGVAIALPLLGTMLEYGGKLQLQCNGVSERT